MYKKTLNFIIPLYNHQRYIKDCLERIIKLELCNVKVIVIDDFSDDNSVAVTKELIEKYKTLKSVTFKLIEKTMNAGVTNSLNLGLKEVEEGLVYFIASDDFIDCESFTKSVAKIVENDLDFLICNGRYFKNNKVQGRIYKNALSDFLTRVMKRKNNALYINYPKPLLLQTCIFKTELLKVIGEWDELIPLDDYPFFIKLFNLHEQKKNEISFLVGRVFG